MHFPQVHKATPVDVKAAADTIVQAFIGDPFNAYFYNLMPDQNNPPWGTKQRMEMHIYNKLFTDLVLVVDDGSRQCAGVALWIPPRFEPVGWIEWGAKLLHSAYSELMGYLYYRNTGENRERYRKFRKVQSETIQGILGKEWRRNTFYLHMLATHPEHQGRGIGSALVRHVTREADRKACRCFLEASKYNPNVPIYEHLGFKLVDTIEMTDVEHSVKIYCMVREPMSWKVVQVEA